jgi:uncharacterized membrane protein
MLVILASPWLGISPTQAQTIEQQVEKPVVQVIMFWLSTCGHCEYVIKEVLPPIQERYGDQLEITLIELVAQEDFDRLYQTADIYGIKKEQVGVPFLIVGEQVLKDSDQIPQELPGLIEQHLAAGGLAYPDHPSLAVYLPTGTGELHTPPSELVEHTAENAPIPANNAVIDAVPEEESKSSASNGFTLAGVVLFIMVASIGYVIYVLAKDDDDPVRQRSRWIDLLIPLLALAGIGVAGYLTYVETQAVQAICGPVGDCNAVQSSSYARLFGVLPVGILGLIGFALILLAWLVGRQGRDKWSSYASLAMLGMALFGTFFSIYLTYLEIWVIEAVCIWCLSSAVLITALLLLSIQPAQQAFDTLLDE